jgi:hypothetical protein
MLEVARGLPTSEQLPMAPLSAGAMAAGMHGGHEWKVGSPQGYRLDGRPDPQETP